MWHWIDRFIPQWNMTSSVASNCDVISFVPTYTIHWFVEIRILKWKETFQSILILVHIRQFQNFENPNSKKYFVTENISKKCWKWVFQEVGQRAHNFSENQNCQTTSNWLKRFLLQCLKYRESEIRLTEIRIATRPQKNVQDVVMIRVSTHHYKKF